MIQANDQIKRVVDESCEIVKEVEKLRLKLRTKLRKSQQLKHKLAGRRNGLKLMREKVADHAPCRGANKQIKYSDNLKTA